VLQTSPWLFVGATGLPCASVSAVGFLWPLHLFAAVCIEVTVASIVILVVAVVCVEGAAASFAPLLVAATVYVEGVTAF
jgi:hypothetical protein